MPRMIPITQDELFGHGSKKRNAITSVTAIKERPYRTRINAELEECDNLQNALYGKNNGGKQGKRLQRDLRMECKVASARDIGKTNQQSQMNAPALRSATAEATYTTPLRTTTHAVTTETAIPVARGRMAASSPRRIMTTAGDP